jgi:hypothetical protein
VEEPKEGAGGIGDGRGGGRIVERGGDLTAGEVVKEDSGNVVGNYMTIKYKIHFVFIIYEERIQ